MRPIAEIEPINTVDRDVEQSEFSSMLSFTDDRRLLVIGDAPGTGKSTLLGRLKYNCMWELDVPVSLVLLEATPDAEGRSTITSPLHFVNWIREDLADTDVPFPTYDFLNSLRLQHLWPAFGDSQESVEKYLEGQLTARGMSLHGEVSANSVDGGEVAGILIKELKLEPQERWAHPELERRSSQGCVKAFFQDLRRACGSWRVVVLIDTYEQRQPELRNWIVEGFIRPLCLRRATRPKQLLVVLAGREKELPQFQQMLPRDFDNLIASRKLLDWTEEHVRDFLTVHKYRLSENDFQIVYGKVQAGWSVRDALALAEIFARRAS